MINAWLMEEKKKGATYSCLSLMEENAPGFNTTSGFFVTPEDLKRIMEAGRTCKSDYRIDDRDLRICLEEMGITWRKA